MVHAQIELERGDLKAAHPFLDSLPANYDPDGGATWTRINLALFERNLELAANTLASYKSDELVGSTGRLVPDPPPRSPASDTV